MPYGSCWTYPGAKTAGGYGEAKVDGQVRYVHRAAYEVLVGPIPAGLQLDHLCRNRACYNPAHLEPVTNRENCLRGSSPWAINAAKEFCVAGHPFDDVNTYWRKDRPGTRQCKQCGLNNAADRRALGRKAKKESK